MITNIIATLLIAVTTNTYSPKQHRVIHHYMTYPVQAKEVWEDGPAVPNPWIDYKGEERNNPDVRITEVREISTLCFAFEGVAYQIVVSDKIISTTTKRRKVTTTEEWEDAQ